MLNVKKETENEYKKINDLYNQIFSNEKDGEMIDRLRKSNAYIPELSLVAEFNDILFGHIMLVKVMIGDDEVLITAPMAAVAGPEKETIMIELFKKSISKAKELGYKSLFLLGRSELNSKIGFKVVSNSKINLPYEVPEGTFWVYELQEGAESELEGLLTFPEV